MIEIVIQFPACIEIKHFPLLYRSESNNNAFTNTLPLYEKNFGDLIMRTTLQGIPRHHKNFVVNVDTRVLIPRRLI